MASTKPGDAKRTKLKHDMELSDDEAEEGEMPEPAKPDASPIVAAPEAAPVQWSWCASPNTSLQKLTQ